MFNLTTLIRETRAENGEPSPEALAGLVWQRVPKSEIEYLAWEYVKMACRTHIGTERRRPVTAEEIAQVREQGWVDDDNDENMTPAAPANRKARVSSAHGRVATQVRKDIVQWLNDGFSIAGVYKRRAEMTFEDLLMAAAERRSQAAANEHWAGVYEKQAAMLQESGAVTVGQLDEATQRALAEVEKS